MPYRIEYSPDAEQHLRILTTQQRAAVFDAVDRQLAHQPGTETRNRKPMRPNPLAPWELRIGNIRVYYDVGEKPLPTVYILAVGVKEHNLVRIGKEVIKL